MANSKISPWCGSLANSLVAVLACLGASSGLGGEKTNVFLIDVCSLRKDHLSISGYTRDTSPRIKTFSKSSTSFENAWAQSSWCLPNFASVLTGVRPDLHRLQSNAAPKLSSRIKTLPEIMKNASFKTAAMTGSRFMTKQYGLDRGFDKFLGVNGEYEESFEKLLPAVKTWITENKADPMFMYMTIDDLHLPYLADNPDLYSQRTEFFQMHSPSLQLFNALNDFPKRDHPLARQFMSDPANRQNLVDLYDASIHRVDRLLGEFFEFLKANQLYDNSLIVLTADHGESLGEHGEFGHITGSYQSVLHVPLLIHDPHAGGKSAKVAVPVERVDVPATILAENGLLRSNRHQFQGHNLLPVMRGEKYRKWRYVFSSSKDSKTDGNQPEEAAVRDSRYKMIWHRYRHESEDTYELYDLTNDPLEKNNIIHSNRDVFDRLNKALNSHLKRDPSKRGLFP